MLVEEGVTELLKALAAHPDTHSDIKALSDSILHMVEQRQTHPGPFNNQTEPENSWHKSKEWILFDLLSLSCAQNVLDVILQIQRWSTVHVSPLKI